MLSATVPLGISAIPEGMEEALQLQIEAELEKTVNELVSEQMVCEELWIEWPMTLPEKAVEKVEDEIDDRVRLLSTSEFPPTLRHDYEKNAKEKYRLFELGDSVSFELENGDIVSGYFREHIKNEILIDNRRVNYSELGEEALAHFDPVSQDVRVKENVRARMAELKEHKSQFEKEIRDEIAGEIYVTTGFMKIDGEWVQKREYVQRELQKRRRALAERLRALLKVKLYYDNGLVSFNGEWTTREDAERQKKLIEEARRKQAASEVSTGAAGGEGNSKESNDEDGDSGGLWD